MLAILCLEEDRRGNGRHLWDITGDQYSAYAKVNLHFNILSESIIFDVQNISLVFLLSLLCILHLVSPLDSIINVGQLNYAVQIIYNPTIFLKKASILSLYLRAYNPVHRTCVILHIVLWANFIFYLAGTFVEAFQCLPVQKAWYPLLSGHCLNRKAAQTNSAAINTSSDFVILVVPLSNV